MSDERNPKTKQEALDLILAAVGTSAHLVVGPGSTEPKELLLVVNRRLGLELDESLSKVELARQVTKEAGLDWPRDGDSTATPSGGGDTVSLSGLRAVLHAVRMLSDARPHAPAEPAKVGRRYLPSDARVDAQPRELLQGWDELDRATRAHARLQNRIAQLVTDAGLDPLSPQRDDPQFDVAWRTRAGFVVCEVKSSMGANARQQVRLGLGQVIEYRARLEQRERPVLAVIACEVAPPEATRRAVLSAGVRLAMSDDLEAGLGPVL